MSSQPIPADAHVFRPHKRQSDFIRVPFDVFEAFYGGAVAGGKSLMFVYLPIVYKFIENPNFRAIMFRKTFPELEKSLIDRSQQIYPLLGARYNDQKHFWKFPSGARVYFSYIQDNKDVRKHDSDEYHLMVFDELTHFTEWQYRYLTSRVRSSDPNLPTIVRSGSNPGNIGHSWVRSRFIEPAPDGYKLIVDHSTVLNGRGEPTKRIYIPAKLEDNPYVNQEYINTLMLLPEAERKAKMEGNWWSFTGQVFSEWREEHIPGEPPNALHVVDPFTIPAWWPKILAVDWGYAAMTWAGWGALSPDGRIYLYREFTARKTSIKEWGAQVGRLARQDENLVAVEMDPSGWKNDGHEQRIVDQFEEASGLVATRADNDRIGGKMLLHDMLRWKPRPPKYMPEEGYDHQKALRIWRMEGDEAVREYQRRFEPEPQEIAIPRLQIFNTCREIIRAIPLCVYDEKRPEDVAPFDGDDPYDGVRYLLKACHRYLEDVVREDAKVQERLKVLTKFEQTKDYNILHRGMERIEREERNAAAPVPRYFHRRTTPVRVRRSA